MLFLLALVALRVALLLPRLAVLRTLLVLLLLAGLLLVGLRVAIVLVSHDGLR